MCRFSVAFVLVALGVVGCAASAPMVDPAAPVGNAAATDAPEKKPSDLKAEELSGKEAEKKSVLSTALTAQDGDSIGLGLRGSGPGGGGAGDGIGLGVVGAMGHGAGKGTGQGYGASGGGHGANRSQVSAATASTVGTGLPPEVIRRLILQRMSVIRGCYDSAIAKDPNISGKLAVKFTIDAQGAVSSAQAADTTIASAEMVTCVVAAIRSISFPSPDGGGTMVVTYPLQFSQADL